MNLDLRHRNLHTYLELFSRALRRIKSAGTRDTSCIVSKRPRAPGSMESGALALPCSAIYITLTSLKKVSLDSTVILSLIIRYREVHPALAAQSSPPRFGVEDSVTHRDRAAF